MAGAADSPPRHPPPRTPPLCLVAAWTSLPVVCKQAVVMAMVAVVVLVMVMVVVMARTPESVVLTINYVHLK